MTHLLKAIRFNYDVDNLDDETLLSYWSALGVAIRLNDIGPFNALVKAMGLTPIFELEKMYPTQLYNHTINLSSLLSEVAQEAEAPPTKEMPSQILPYEKSYVNKDSPVYAEIKGEHQ